MNESTASAIVHRRKILYKSTQFVICDDEDFDQEWTEFRELCASDTASNVAWNLFQKVMKASYDSEDKFENALFQALAKALGEKCCHLDSDKMMIILRRQKHWGFA